MVSSFNLKTEGYMEIKLDACNSGGVDLKAGGAIADVRIEQQADARKLHDKRPQRVRRPGRPNSNARQISSFNLKIEGYKLNR